MFKKKPEGFENAGSKQEFPLLFTVTLSSTVVLCLVPPAPLEPPVQIFGLILIARGSSTLAIMGNYPRSVDALAQAWCGSLSLPLFSCNHGYLL